MANVATAILNISPQKELNRLDQMILRTKEFQKELDYRKEVEDEVFRLFSEGKFEGRNFLTHWMMKGLWHLLSRSMNSRTTT